MTSYYHGGKPGLQRGAFILPPSITGARSLADFGAESVCRRDRVYVTTSKEAALLYAAGVKNGVIYECQPVGQIEPDPDCLDPTLSFECEKARVLKIIKPKPREIEAARAALFSGLR